MVALKWATIPFDFNEKVSIYEKLKQEKMILVPQGASLKDYHQQLKIII